MLLNNLLLSYLRYFPVEYGKSWLRRFVRLPSQPIVYTTKYRAKFKLYPDEYQMKEIYCYDLYEKNTISNLVKLVKPHYTFIDVGANAGFYSIILSGLLNRGKVYSFEPNSFTVQRLMDNIALNNAGNIVVNQVGLSDKEEMLDLVYDTSNTGSASVYKAASDGKRKESIRLIPFDEYYFSNHIGQIDVIKADIEGGEMKFLLGAEKAIKKNCKLIIVLEMMDEHFRAAGYSSGELFTYMRRLGFEAYLPKPFPFGLTHTTRLPAAYFDNLVFLRGY
jgi:FkbM family methyltransferase